MCSVLDVSMSRVKLHKSAHARQKYVMWKKKCQLRPIVECYIIDLQILIVMCIPNPVYDSLDVRCTVFFYNYKFRERDDVGACLV